MGVAPGNPRNLGSLFQETTWHSARLAVAAGVAVYAFFALAHSMVLPPGVAEVMVPMAAATALAFLLLWMGTRTMQPKRMYGEYLLIAAGMLAGINAVTHMSVAAEIHQTTNIMLLVFLAGSMFSTWLVFALFSLVLVVLWVLAVGGIPSGNGQVIHYAFALSLATAVSILVFIIRRRVFARVFEVVDRQGSRASNLAGALDQLSEAKALNEQIASVLPDFVLVIDYNGMVVTWRPSGEYDFLRRVFPACPSNLSAVLDAFTRFGMVAGRREQIEAMIRRVQETAESQFLDLVLQDEGKSEYFEAYVFPRDGRSFVMVLRDNTETIMAQQALIREDAARRQRIELEAEMSRRAEIQKELDHSLSMLKAAFEAVEDGLLVLDSYGNIVRYNQRFLRMWDLPDQKDLWRMQSLIHTSLSEQVHDADVTARMLFSPDSIDNNTGIEIIETNDGRVIEIYGHPQLSDGKVMGRVWTFRDITQLMQSVKALRRSQANMESILESASHAFVLLGPDGKIELYNGRAQQYASVYFGLDIARIDAISHAAINDEIKEYFARALAGESIHTEVEYAGFSFELTCTPASEDGHVEGVTFSVVNIDSRKRAVQALRESEESLRLALDAANLTFWEFEIPSRALIWHTRAVEPIHRVLEEVEINPGSLLQYVAEADKVLVQNLLQNATGSEQMIDAEIRFNVPDGTERWVHVIGRAVSERPWDKDERWIGVISDITDRKEYEQRLRDAKEHAEEANKLKNSILANMSHELRTPLTSILGFSEILGRKVEDAGLRSNADTIHRSGKRLLLLLDSIIDIAKLDANKMDLRPESHAVSAVVDQVMLLFEDSIAGKDIALSTDVPGQLYSYADRRREQQILAVMLDNAIRFTESGSISIRVAEAQGMVRWEVQDTGIGISSEFLPFVFDEFRQESEGLARSYEGSGIGLSLARRLVDRMGGDIGIESSKGVGTTVWFTLPLGESGAASPDFIAATLAAEQRESLEFRCLYVGPDLRTAVSTHDGYAIDSITAFNDLFTLGDAGAYDVLLLELLVVPALDFSVLVQQIRQVPALRSTQIVLLVKRMRQKDIDRLLQSGVNDVATLPVNLADLVSSDS